MQVATRIRVQRPTFLKANVSTLPRSLPLITALPREGSVAVALQRTTSHDRASSGYHVRYPAEEDGATFWSHAAADQVRHSGRSRKHAYRPDHQRNAPSTCRGACRTRRHCQ
jgi:hypothetical protein